MNSRLPIGASRLWGRRVQQVVRVNPGANVTLEVSGRGDNGRHTCFLRLCRSGREALDLDFELRLLRAIGRAPEADVARPVAGRGGRLRFRLPWEGTIRHAVLFTAAPGRPMRHDAADLACYGRGLAALHDTMAATGLISRQRIEAVASCRDAAHWLRQAGQDAAALADMVEAVAPRLSAGLEVANPTLGLLHGDSCLLNARLEEGGRVTFFDFETCGHGPVALDLASVRAWLGDAQESGSQWAALLDGYASRRLLKLGDRQALPALVLLAAVRVTGALARFFTMAPDLWREQHERLKRAIEGSGVDCA